MQSNTVMEIGASDSSSQHLDALRDLGFCVIPSVAEPTLIEQAKSLTDEIVAYAEEGLEDPFWRYYLRHRNDQGVLYDLYQRHPEFQMLAKNPQVLNTLTGVLGEDIFLYENSLVYKPSGRANAVPWHQDFLSRPDEPMKYIAWITLDPVTEANGTLKVIPGSHRQGYLPWKRIKGETHHDRVLEEYVKEEDAVYVEMAAGDALIFDARLLHSSDECHSDDPRRAYRISYQGFDALTTPRGTPIVLHGGRPSSLRQRYPQSFHAEPKWKDFLRRVGKRLAKI
ncbi:MAG: phytanoyl-CoA dioxygenase family protein [Pseudomonadota bacterium]